MKTSPGTSTHVAIVSHLCSPDKDLNPTFSTLLRNGCCVCTVRWQSSLCFLINNGSTIWITNILCCSTGCYLPWDPECLYLSILDNVTWSPWRMDSWRCAKAHLSGNSTRTLRAIMNVQLKTQLTTWRWLGWINGEWNISCMFTVLMITEVLSSSYGMWLKSTSVIRLTWGKVVNCRRNLSKLL